jgi:hypothetical protein
MVHLLKEKVFLPQEIVLVSFQRAALSDIFDSNQKACAVVAFIENLSGVEQHYHPTDGREIVLNFEAFYRGVLRDDSS